MSNNGLIVLVPYSSGQEFYFEYGYEEEMEEENEENDGAEADDEIMEAYLPVYVETEDKNLALMAVACEVGKYVAFSSSFETAQQWEANGYPGTVENPGIDLPRTCEAFEIPEPGDCFCCASMEDYEVIAPPEMLKRIQGSPDGYILSALEDDDDLWQQFNDWCIKVLSYSLYTK